MPFVLLLGGARSGKSALAVGLAARSGSPVTLVATAMALDDEMAERIAQHRALRPASWTTVEEPIAVTQAVRAAAPDHFLVIDCLTLWVSNLLGSEYPDRVIVDAAAEVAQTLAARHAGAVVVSNEVGLGIVPVNPLARGFRDTLGRVNTTFAAAADRTVLVVAGRVAQLMSAADLMEGMPWQPREPHST
jgi:adenosylcobinamide kinase / adenosylcobinamide-phosphate guanylyltransferase